VIRTVQKGEMMGQPMDIIFTLSNFQKADNGFAMAYNIEENFGGQFFLVMNITKVEFNNPIDLAIFAKP
jgi:hypothetical protein